MSGSDNICDSGCKVVGCANSCGSDDGRFTAFCGSSDELPASCFFFRYLLRPAVTKEDDILLEQM